MSPKKPTLAQVATPINDDVDNTPYVLTVKNESIYESNEAFCYLNNRSD